MKKLIFVVVAVALSMALTVQAKPVKKSAGNSTANVELTTHCYVMMKGAMSRCMWSSAEPMTADATLSNGTKVTTKGAITTKDGKKSMLAEGYCIDMMGNIVLFTKLHPAK